MTLTVSEVAQQVGVSPDTIRYYSRSRLLPEAERSPAGYRLFRPETVDRVRLIKGAQRLGLRLREIRDLLEVVDRGLCPCGHTASLIERRLAEIDSEIAQLASMKKELLRVAAEVPAEDRAVQPWPCQTEFIKVGGGECDGA